MAEPEYTVFVRVPAPRGDFVDPPQVHWDPSKDEVLWKILSGAAQTEIDCELCSGPDVDVQLTAAQGTKCMLSDADHHGWSRLTPRSAERFDVPVDFLLQQVAYLTERHASQVRAQVRKATAAAKGSSAPSPVPGAEHLRTTSALSVRRDSPMTRHDGSTAATPLAGSGRPIVSRMTSANNTVLKDAGRTSPRLPSSAPSSARAAEQGGRRHLSSLPMASPAAKSPKVAPESDQDGRLSPGPAGSNSTTSSDDEESSPAQSRIIRRPPRYQQQEAPQSYQDEDGDESEPAFQPYQAPSDRTSAQDLASTLKGDGKSATRRGHKSSAKDAIHQSQTSNSSAGSAAMLQRPSKTRDQKGPGPLSPRRTAELAGRSPGGGGKAGSREGSDGAPSMGSSFSDLDGIVAQIRNAVYLAELPLTRRQTRPSPSRRWKRPWPAT
ncbi:Multidomain presynaptic cytomatrix related protein [Tolypocladium capitatum]|uniref:Autophagy-related protein 29 n=1 Tax=Tolypocladium capitatum TaxID=45235 RepID=A0A2K3Q5X2_9HYPO|nr:Multidomain presynaptic cytomatrix related protein [Tolypocladium capitatum]